MGFSAVVCFCGRRRRRRRRRFLSPIIDIFATSVVARLKKNACWNETEEMIQFLLAHTYILPDVVHHK